MSYYWSLSFKGEKLILLPGYQFIGKLGLQDALEGGKEYIKISRKDFPLVNHVVGKWP